MAQYYNNYHHVHHPHRGAFRTALAALAGMAGGVIVLVLVSRFILSLLAVDRLEPFANFVYSLSYPFVAPFFTIFNYQQQMGVLRFEYQTIVAILFWALATWILVRLLAGETNEY